MILSSFIKGITAALMLLVVYFTIVTLVSNWTFAKDQFSRFWYFVVSLAAGFGVQIGLYTYLRSAIRGKEGSKKVLAVSGTTSTMAMVSCCIHYLANILPIIATAGIVTLVAQYQIELFWVGLAFNLAGIAYMSSRVFKFIRHA